MSIADIFKSCAETFRDRARTCDSAPASERFNYLAGYFERRATQQEDQIGAEPDYAKSGLGPW